MFEGMQLFDHKEKLIKISHATSSPNLGLTSTRKDTVWLLTINK